MTVKAATNTANCNTASDLNSIPEQTADINVPSIDILALANFALKELQAEMKTASRSAQAVAMRIAKEVERICQKSDRIQISGEVEAWQITLAQAPVAKNPAILPPRFQTRPRRTAFSPRGDDLPPCCFFPIELELPSSLQHD